MAPPGPSVTDGGGIALVADRGGRASRDILDRALAALDHFTSISASATSSPGSSGILTAIPWDLYAPELPVPLRDPIGQRIAATFALDPAQADRAILAARAAMSRLGWFLVSWREVPTRAASSDGITAVRFVQCFARAPRERHRHAAYRTRLAIEARWIRLGLTGCSVLSLSDATIVYKAAGPLRLAFPDLDDPRFAAAYAIVHADSSGERGSVRQPFHLLAHRGEVRSITANRSWMEARMADAGVRDDADPGARASDAQTLDAAVQWLREAGLSTTQALARLMPPAWNDDHEMPAAVRAFFRHESCFGEPWDGPAALVFADGRHAGAVRGRVGSDALYEGDAGDCVCVASNARASIAGAGEPQRITEIDAGQMLVLDLLTGEARRGAAVWQSLAEAADDASRMRVPIRFTSTPRATDATGDAHVAARASRDRTLFECCVARSASAAGSSLGPPRVSLRTLLGRRGQWSPHALAPLLLELDSPVLCEADVSALVRHTEVRTATLPAGFAVPAAGAAAGELQRGVRAMQTAAAALAANGARIIVLSDRHLPSGAVAIPALLAVAAADEALRTAGLRLRASLVVDSGEMSDGRDVAILAGYGASAVVVSSASQSRVEAELREAVAASGVCAFEAFRGARLFEPRGLDAALAAYFGVDAAAVPAVTLGSLAEGAIRAAAVSLIASPA